jgi:predicted Zn-dependent peptidase
VVPVAEELKVIREMTLEAIRTQSREPSSVFRNRVRYVNYGGCYYFAPMTARQFKRVCADEACAFFNSSFHNPAEFTVVLVGALDTKTAIPLIEQYLGTLPEQSEPAPKKRASLTPLPFSFPTRVVDEEVRVAMVEPNNATQITFPVQLTSDDRVGCHAEVHWVALATRLLESRLLNLLRFKYGEVYSVSVSAFFGAEGPGNKQSLRGDVAIYFTCDPEAAQRLRGLALDELSRLQEEGPSAEDVATAVELETRAYEVAKQENSHWAECISNAYQSRFFDDDVDAAYNTSVRCRSEVMATATPEAMRAVLRRVFPYPCRSRYTALTLLPQRPWYRRPVPLSLTVAVAAATVYGVVHWRRR